MIVKKRTTHISSRDIPRKFLYFFFFFKLSTNVIHPDYIVQFIKKKSF